MSKKTRRRLDAGLKAKVALEALRNEATIAALAAKYQLHPNQIYAWKKQLIDGAAGVFADGVGKESNREAEVNELYTQIGQLTVERDFLSRRVRAMNRAEGVAMVERGRAELSVRRQCALLGLPRSGIYRKPAAPDPGELALMRWLDEQYLATPFYGSRRMTAELRRTGRRINRKRLQRLMRLMGLEALGPKPKTRRPSAQHRI